MYIIIRKQISLFFFKLPMAIFCISLSPFVVAGVSSTEMGICPTHSAIIDNQIIAKLLFVVLFLN